MTKSAFTGIGIATATGAQLIPKVAFGWLPQSWNTLVDRIADIVTALFLCAVTYVAWTFVDSSRDIGMLTSGGISIEAWKIQAAIPAVAEALNPNNWLNAAQGILTTDTRPKGASVQLDYAGHTITINGISKGAGMIMPNMATMLGFIGTDAKLSQNLVSSLVKEFSDLSFNRITIDGDTSTNDSCMLLASGCSHAPEITEDHEDYPKFKGALRRIFVQLAQAIVRDGEGATKFVSVIVEQAKDVEEALGVAYTIAHSPLIKTALFASDPNWGRILAALGRAPIESLDLGLVEIFLGEVRIVQAGEKCSEYTEARGQMVMDRDEISIRLCLGRGNI